MMMVRNMVLGMLFVTVIAPILLYSHRFSSYRNELLEDVSSLTLSGDDRQLNVLSQESSEVLKEQVDAANSTLSLSEDISASSDENSVKGMEHISSRVLSTADDRDRSRSDATIRQVTDTNYPTTNAEKKDETVKEWKGVSIGASRSVLQPDKVNRKDSTKVNPDRRSDHRALPDVRVRQLRDQLIRAKVYLSLSAMRRNPRLARELRLRIKELQRVLGDATKDTQLPKGANDKAKAMDQTLAKANQIQDDCETDIKKLRAMLQSTEGLLRVHRKQTLFLTQLTAKTLPKGLHCLPLRLTTEYYSLNSSQQEFPHQDNLENPKLYHYALFSDNVLATAVVVNSTVTHAKDPSKHVFHIVTDRLNYAAMRMWFLMNPPSNATIQVQNVEEFTWLNASYSPVIKQLGSRSMIDYYFRAHHANSDSNMKYRNPKYLSILNHLRFYLPEIFPKLRKVLFLDDDIVVQKDLTDLWSVDLKGNVNGAVETCRESFHRFDRYLNFSNPLISKNFDPRACGWAYGMNIFDLNEWRRQNITEVYHGWQKLNHNRLLWKLGTLPPGLITFWKRTYPLDRSWHVLGLGYDPSVNQKEIETAAVIHYNGNMKPWLEIGMPKYRNYWVKHVDYDLPYLRECNISP